MMKSRIVIDPMIRGGDDLVKRSFRMRNEHGMKLSLQLQKTDFSVFYFILCSERAAVLAKHQFHAEISEIYYTHKILDGMLSLQLAALITKTRLYAQIYDII